ncbi:MAG TPA: Ig-like domain-containing protein [Actinomycetota bacterium]|nr:Ig-like domain-containing protein [Actinomycetota bacterium]
MAEYLRRLGFLGMCLLMLGSVACAGAQETPRAFEEAEDEAADDEGESDEFEDEGEFEEEEVDDSEDEEFPNTPPVAEDDRVRVRAGQKVVIDVLANDSDADGDELFIFDVGDGQKGKASIDDSEMIIYKAHRDARGTEEIVYEIDDDFGGLATATITITITRR